jgi:hypothetical protein
MARGGLPLAQPRLQRLAPRPHAPARRVRRRPRRVGPERRVGPHGVQDVRRPQAGLDSSRRGQGPLPDHGRPLRGLDAGATCPRGGVHGPRTRPPYPPEFRAEAVRLVRIGGPTVLIEVQGWRLLTRPDLRPPAAGPPWITGDSVLDDGVRQIADRLQAGTPAQPGRVRFPVTASSRTEEVRVQISSSSSTTAETAGQDATCGLVLAGRLRRPEGVAVVYRRAAFGVLGPLGR